MTRLGPLHEKAALLVNVADQERRVRVAVDAVDVGGDVDVADVAVLEASRVRDPVADAFVDRRTQ